MFIESVFSVSLSSSVNSRLRCNSVVSMLKYREGLIDFLQLIVLG